ncbi:MAG: hypothetical protein HYS43_00685 [Candidatus Liptonbacteria bacterium]|nr:hypothetical protein [Candidatus Liptonbacteria bacterium]
MKESGIAGQISREFRIENEDRFKRRSKSIVVGMGGSNLAAGLLRARNPLLDVVIHRNYGLPPLSEQELRERLIVVSSYSGTTEEALDAFREASAHGYERFVIASGGALLESARRESIPHIALPSGMNPRGAIGSALAALAAVLEGNDAVTELRAAAKRLDEAACMEQGSKLAERLGGSVPVIYASAKNEGIAYIWKIQLNETAKIPAFYNVFPEENHNEFMGFSPQDGAKDLANRFSFVLLADAADDPRIAKRMDIFEKMYRAAGFPVERVSLTGTTPFEKILSSLAVGDGVSRALARIYGADPDDSSVIEEFKRRMKE